MEEYYVFNKKFRLHYYGNKAIIYHIYKTNFAAVEIPEIAITIIELCDGTNTLKDIISKLKENYTTSKFRNIESIKKFLDNAIKKDIIYITNKKRKRHLNISGKKHYKFPYMLLLELTNQCNFYCKHCYKQACANKNDFLPYKDICNLLNYIRNKTPMLALSGGEPTLHPDINKIIQYAKEDFSIFLYTNGSNLEKISENNLKLLSLVTISMYGNSDKIYQEITKNIDGFFKFTNSVKRLIKNNINTQITITLNKLNMQNLEDYIEKVHNMGVKNISFGISMPAGRILEEKESDWLLSLDEIKTSIIKINSLSKKYRDMNLQTTNEQGGLLGYDVGTLDKCNSFKCTANGNVLTISERGKIRPCVMLPPDIYEHIDYNEYFSNIISQENNQFDKKSLDLEQYLLKKGFKLEDMKCKGFYS